MSEALPQTPPEFRLPTPGLGDLWTVTGLTAPVDSPWTDPLRGSRYARPLADHCRIGQCLRLDHSPLDNPRLRLRVDHTAHRPDDYEMVWGTRSEHAASGRRNRKGSHVYGKQVVHASRHLTSGDPIFVECCSTVTEEMDHLSRTRTLSHTTEKWGSATSRKDRYMTRRFWGDLSGHIAGSPQPNQARSVRPNLDTL